MDSLIKILPFLLTSIGLVGLIVGLFQVQPIIRSTSSQSRIWKGLSWLISLFIGGYTLFMTYMMYLPFAEIHLITSIIFAGGGGFVAMVTYLSHHTIQDIQKLEEIKRLNRQLQYDINHDELTGLCKRHYFIEALNIALRNRQSYQRPAVVWYIDLNKFKQINDKYGHLAGDQVLISIAKLFRRHFRESDIIARLGGDEFAVLMNDTQLSDAKKSQARLLENMRSLEIPFEQHKLKVSISIGMTEVQPNQQLEEIINMADKYCYQFKNGLS